MKVVVNVKQIGKRKNAIDQRVYELKAPIGTVEDLIKAFVGLEVEAFNQKKGQYELVQYLTDEVNSENRLNVVSSEKLPLRGIVISE